MTFVRLAFFPAATGEHYRALEDELGSPPAPEGRLVFAAGPTAGGWQVVQVWTDRAGLDEFNATVLLPALRRLGDRGFPQPPVVTDFEPVALELAGTGTLPSPAGRSGG